MSITVDSYDVATDVLIGLLWQNNNAPNLTALLESKQAWYTENVDNFISDWVRDVFDLRTANEFGCQVWSRILNMPLQIYIPPSPNKFGFGQFHKNFNRGNFSSVNGSVANLTIEEQRIALQLRYLKLTFKPTVPNINRILKWVLGSFGNSWVLDGNDMSTTYVFDFTPGSKLSFILEQYDLLPRPSAVEIDYVTVGYPAFGFGPFKRNFNRGVFRR